MEKKNNNVVVIILVGIIIIIVLLLCVLFVTGIISFNNIDNNQNINNDQQLDNNVVESSNNTYILTNSEAEAVSKNIFINEVVRSVIDNPQLQYCKHEDTLISASDLGLDYQWIGFYKATDFNSYEEYINYLKTYFTDEYFSNNVENKKTVATKSVELPDGTVHYNFYEKDGALYCANDGKGSNMDKGILYKVECNIVSISYSEIESTIDASWYDGNFSFSKGASEKINMKIVKENNVWKISSYEVK